MHAIPDTFNEPLYQTGTQISRRKFLKMGAVSVAAMELTIGQAASELFANAKKKLTFDVFVYGSTPSGVAAACEASRRGCKVLLACPQKHPGGMLASGLCAIDTGGRRDLFGGFMDEYGQRIRREYQRVLGPAGKSGFGGTEPSISEKVFEDLLGEQSERLQYFRKHHLLDAQVMGGRITEVTLLSPKGEKMCITARTFIDSTYEGDLAACAKVPYRVSREGCDEYGESLAGIHYMNTHTGKRILTPDSGESSPAIQAYCARAVFTDDPKHLVPIEKPDTYEQHLEDYLPLLLDFKQRRVTSWGLGARLARHKYEQNGRIDALTSINCPGISWAWPEAERFHRERLARFHVDHVAGLIWFFQNHPDVPDQISRPMRTIGLHDGEFIDNGHWPWQIYVRQGRRIEGRAMVTQHNFTPDPKTGRTPRVEHPIALGTYTCDVHPCHDRRFAVEGFNEGVLWFGGSLKHEKPTRPGQIPYAAMLPKRLDNILVPVCLSSTHIGMSVVRMEPVWMTTGQVAGLAAAMAQEKQMDVANLNPTDLPELLKIPIDPAKEKGL